MIFFLGKNKFDIYREMSVIEVASVYILRGLIGEYKEHSLKYSTMDFIQNQSQ